MEDQKKWNLNKKLIITIIILIIIAIIVGIIIAFSNNTPKEINYEDTVIAKLRFSEITIDITKKETKRDGKTILFRDMFDTTEEAEFLAFSSQEELVKFFNDSTYEVSFENGIAHITDKYQTKKIILEVKDPKGRFNAQKVEEEKNNIYILTFDTEKRTKEAYEYLKNIEWIDNIELDKVFRVQNIPDESQTLYGEQNTEDNSDNYRSYGVKAMGLDNYQNIIQENGNPSDVIVSTIGYGAAINNSYFTGRISEKSYNFISNSPNIYETIPQGSRILEVIKESTSHNVKIMPLVVIDDDGYTTTATILNAISYAYEKSDVICYELVHGKDYMISLMLKGAFSNNIPVCAVTTSEIDAKENYPANDSTTIAVSSIDKSSNITNFSAQGDFIDFAAYSTDVEEIFNTSTSVSKWSGAEYSNAHIASAIALIKTYHKEYTILEIYNMLRSYCKDLGDSEKDEKYGYGVPNFSDLKISDLDKKEPEMQDIIVDNEKWEKTKNIVIKANDNIRILGWQISENGEKPQEWNNLEILSTELETVASIEKNGNFYVWVTDSAGNAVSKTINIEKVDSVGPNIQYTIDNSKIESEKYVIVKIIATDEQSGLHEFAYSTDGENWQREYNEFKVTENGTYTIYVRDQLENVEKKEIVINSFINEEPEIQEDILDEHVILDEGAVIKSINVSKNWNENINSEVKITFRDNLNIANWKITENNIMPSEFNSNGMHSEADENENETVTLEDITNNTTDTNTNSNSTNTDANTNTNTNTSNNTRNSVQGRTNLVVTVALSADRKYYVWVQLENGNVDVQTFKIKK